MLCPRPPTLGVREALAAKRNRLARNFSRNRSRRGASNKTGALYLRANPHLTNHHELTMKTPATLALCALLAAVPSAARADTVIRTDYFTQSQGAITGGTWRFEAVDLLNGNYSFGLLNANSSLGVTGGTQNFYNGGLTGSGDFLQGGGPTTTGLRATAANAITGNSIQNFYDSTVFGAEFANSVSGGTQNLFDQSYMLVLANAALSGGTQIFSGSSYLYVKATNGVIDGSTQKFYNSSTLYISRGNVHGGTQEFHDESSAVIDSPSAISGGTQSFSNNAQLRFSHFNASFGFPATVTGGIQNFTDNAAALASEANALSGGTQNFTSSGLGNAHLIANAAGAVSGISTQNFSGESYLTASSINAVSGGTQNFTGSSHLDADFVAAVSGGTQNFAGFSVLNANSGLALGGSSTQNLSGFAVLNANEINAVSGNNTINFTQSSKLNANVARSVGGGTQNFAGSSRLIANIATAINGGTQNFSGQASLDARVANGVTGGTQNFSGTSYLDAKVINAVTGGVQTFSQDSYLLAQVAGSVNATSMTFNDSTRLEINASGAVNVGALTFNDDAYLNANVANSIGLNAFTINDRATVRANATGAISGASANFLSQTSLEINAANGADIAALSFGGAASLDANVGNSITTGTQDFSGSSFLLANASQSVNGGAQTFSGASGIIINAATGISGGLQTFLDASYVTSYASNGISDLTPDLHFSADTHLTAAGTDSVAGGRQFFSGNAFLDVTASFGLGGQNVPNSTDVQYFSGMSQLRAAATFAVKDGNQYFSENSSLVATAQSSVGGHQHFSGDATMDVFATGAASGGMQDFVGRTSLNIYAEGGLSGSGTQNFTGPDTRLNVIAAGGVTGGTQNFTNVPVEANVARALNGGVQNFNGTSVLNGNALAGVNSGTQTFLNNSILDAKVAGAVSGGVQNFRDNATIRFQAAGAVTGGTQNFSGGNVTIGNVTTFQSAMPVTIDRTEAFAGTSTQNFSAGSLLYAIADSVGDSTTQNFTNYSGAAVTASYGIDGGTQNFSGFSSLSSNVSHGINRGTQTLQGGSHLYANVADAITGGTQNVSGFLYAYATGAIGGGTQNITNAMFLGESPYNLYSQNAPNANNVTDGTQNFTQGTSQLFINTANNFGNSTQNFYAGTLFANASGAVGGGRQFFTGDYYVYYTDPNGVDYYAQRSGGTLQTIAENSITGGRQEFYHSALLTGEPAFPLSINVSGNGFDRQTTGYAVSGGTQIFRGYSTFRSASFGVANVFHDADGPQIFESNGFPVLDASGNPTYYYSQSQGTLVQVFGGTDVPFLDGNGNLTHYYYQGEQVRDAYGAPVLGSLAFGVTGNSRQEFHDESIFQSQNSKNPYLRSPGDQNFHATIGGGEQHFFDDATLRGETGWAASGGAQTFHDRSFFYLSGYVTGGTQNYYDSSKLVIQSGLVDGADIALHDNSSISLLRVNGELPTGGFTRNTNISFENSKLGTVGGTIYLNGDSYTVGRISSTGGAGIITNEPHSNPVYFNGLGTGERTANATLTVDFDGAASTFGGRIEDGFNADPLLTNKLSLAKHGDSTLMLTNVNAFTGGIAVRGGKLQLDYSNATIPMAGVSNTNEVLALNRGTFEIVGKSGGNITQSFTGFHAEGGASKVILTPNEAASLSVDLGDFGSNVTRAVGATVDFVNSAGGTFNQSSEAASGQVAFGWATINNGTSWASKGGTELTGLTNYASTWAAGNNTDVLGNLEPDANSTTNTLRFNQTAAYTVALSGTNTIASGGLLVTANVGANVSTITGGQLAGKAGEDLIVHQHNTNAALVINSDIVNNGGPTGFTKSGAGAVVLGGMLLYTGVTTVNEGKLVTDATFAGGASVRNGATLAGNAIYGGSVLVEKGGILSPGHSPGVTTAESSIWGESGVYLWEINDALGTAGTLASGWDLFSVDNALTITATSANPYVIQVHSLTLANVAGNAANFSSGQNYAWKIASTGAGIVGFNSSFFSINTANFTNTFAGTFSVGLTNSNKDLNLIYTVPEPSSAVLLGVGAAAIALLRRRRKA